MQTRKVQLIDRSITLEVYSPTGGEPAPGILLLHEVSGLRDPVREDAKDLAEKGYLVYVPDLFSADAAKYCVRAMVLAAGRKNHHKSIPAKEVHCLLDELKKDDACNGRLGMLGACLTGGFVIQMAKRDDMLAPVLYHHSLGIEDAGVPQKETLNEVVRLQAHWSNFDPICPAARQRKLKEKLGDRLEDYYYNMPHGFRSVSRILPGSQVVWDRTTNFFDEHLKG